MHNPFRQFSNGDTSLFKGTAGGFVKGALKDVFSLKNVVTGGGYAAYQRTKDSIDEVKKGVATMKPNTTPETTPYLASTQDISGQQMQGNIQRSRRNTFQRSIYAAGGTSVAGGNSSGKLGG